MKEKRSNRKHSIIGLSDNAHLALMVAECGYFCQETWMALAKFLCNAEYKRSWWFHGLKALTRR